MYGECKLGTYDTKEGLSLTTVLSANILNYATPSTPTIVLHTNDFRFHVQVVTLNTDNSTLCVWKRDGYAYHLNPQGCPPINRKGQEIQQEYIHIPLIYKYGKVLQKYLNPDELPNKNIYDLPQYPKSPQSPEDSFEIGKIRELPEYPHHYLVVEKVQDTHQILQMWINMDRNLREFMVAIWETTDILVSTMFLQDPEVAADNYKESLTKGTLKIPSKLPKSIVPYGRAAQIKSHMFKYHNIKYWDTPYLNDRNWVNTLKVAWQQFNFTSMLVKEFFDAHAEYFGLHMFNLPKHVENPDIVGALSENFETISISAAQAFIQPKYLVDNKDVNLLDIVAQEACRHVKKTPCKQRVQTATAIAGPYDPLLQAQPQGPHPVTCAYSQLHA